MSQPHVFPVIVGVGRSGTTLLRLMLDAHPDLAIPPETHFLLDLYRFRALADARPAFMETAIQSGRWDDFGISPETMFAALQGPPLDASQCLRRFYALYAERFGKPRCGDKTPMYVGSMPAVQALLPEAAFIHIIRDGRDVALSSRGSWFGERTIEEQARRWVEMLTRARADGAALPRYMELKYENLIDDPESELRGVCDFVGLDYDASMLRYHETAGERIGALQEMRDPRGRLVASAEQRRGIHAMTQQAPSAERVGRWRSEMSDAEQRQYEAIAGEMLRAHGYETRF